MAQQDREVSPTLVDLYEEFNDKEHFSAFSVCVAWWCLGQSMMYGPKNDELHCLSSDMMTNVYAEWVIVVHCCSSLRISCISAGGRSLPPGPPHPIP